MLIKKPPFVIFNQYGLYSALDINQLATGRDNERHEN